MNERGEFRQLSVEESMEAEGLLSRGERTPDLNLVAVFPMGEEVVMHGFVFTIAEIRRRCIILKPKLEDGKVVRGKHPMDEENEDLRTQNERLRSPTPYRDALVDLVDRMACTKCRSNTTCEFAWDLYNLNESPATCLAVK